MTADRWQQIERIYQAALERPAEVREAFLRETCADDQQLRSAVEALLQNSPQDQATQTLEFAPPSAQRRIGSYEVLDLLGKGGMGEVFRARDLNLGREVAIKMLPASMLSDPDRLSRFRREAQLLASLNHPNIAIVYELEESVGQPCLIMELIPGDTLADRIRKGPVPVDEVSHVCSEIAAALSAAHRQHIVHRDIKPANVKITPAGWVKILDFGLAKALHEDPGATLTELTQPGTVLGTPAYMSPEQLRGAAGTHLVDVWAFGCVLFELLSGQRPFQGTTVAETMAAILKTEPDWSALPGGTPAVLRNLAGSCLQKDPQARLASMSEAHDALRTNKSLFESRAAGFQKDDGIRSIAVLPFENGSGNPQSEYLSDGLTESIIFSLSQVPGLRVMARATVFRYKGRTSEAQAIGQTLGVSAILTGRVVERQKNLMVTAELIDPANGWQLWGSQFHRNSADLLALEENIANEISGALRSKLSGVSDATPRPQTENVEAHRLYLKGRYYWGKRTEEALKKAIQHFHKAIDLDPGYARAYAGLSEGFVPLAFYGHVAPRDALAKARSAAEKALELDPDSAEAWTVLGSVRGILDWDEAGAVDVIRKAIALDPNYSRARQSLGERYMALGNPEEAVIEMQRALELDPLSLSLHAAVGMAQFYAGRYDEAIEICRKAVDMDPTFYPARWQLALCLTEKADFEQAVGELKEASELSKESMNIRASLAAALAGWGRLDDAREVLGQMEQMRKRRYVSGTLVASVHMRLEDSGGALVELERAVEERCCWVRYLRIDPRFQELSQDPRLQELLSRMGTSPPQGVSP